MPRLMLLTVALALAACTKPESSAPRPALFLTDSTQWPEDRFVLDQTSAHLRTLAADEMMGRDPGTPGGDAAAHYIAEQFRAAGVQPMEGAEEYFQYVPLAEQRPAEIGLLTWNATAFEQGSTLLVMGGPAAEFNVEAVDAGFATPDDLGAVDVDGKIAFVRFGQPDDQSLGGALRAMTDKAERLAKAGAVGVVEVYQGGRPLATVIDALQSGRLALSTGAPVLPYVWVTDAEGALLARAETAALGTMRLQSSGVQTIDRTSPNVVGIIEGTDPALRGEYLLLMAHYDHIGAGLDKRGATPADSIFNGARDNGMGTVGIINAAHALAEVPPRRSVIVLAVTAEESGLIGSRYFVDYPLVALRDIVYVLNIDNGGYNDTSIVTVVGLGRTTADPHLEAGAARYGLGAIADPSPGEGLFNRSDNVNFARVGIPAPTFSAGFHAFDAEIMKYYHQPADEADEHFDFGYLLKFTQAYTHAARLIANDDVAPFWVAGDPYEAAGKTLYDR
ncbi:MAG: M28 family peptidase [Bacteroidota bacterium]